MDQFLIPANTKKSQLIFNMFRPRDLILFGSGAFVTLILMFTLPGNSIKELVYKLAPVAITGFIVMPIPFYHNVGVFLREVFVFFTNRRRYLWKGWCVNSYGREEEEGK